jgi:putative exporter of polyketide antibiotics
VAASTAGSGSLRALYGPVFDTGIGGLTAWRTMAFGAALSGLMAILLVVRHTREEEEAGRLELVGAGAIGRRAPLAAALVTGFGARHSSGCSSPRPCAAATSRPEPGGPRPPVARPGAGVLRGRMAAG